MGELRILAIAESAATRRALRGALEARAVQALAVASEGAALARVAEFEPHAVLVELSIGEGRWAPLLDKLREAAPQARIVALVGAGADEAQLGKRAKAAGANEWSEFEPAESARFVEQLVASLESRRAAAANVPAMKSPTLNSQKGESASSQKPALPASAVRPRPAALGAPARVECVVIGVSTGGPNALSSVLPALPAEFPVPIVIVQHMPPVFTSNLAQNLQSLSRVRVCEARDGQPLEPGLAMIAPGDEHLTVQRKGANVVVSLHHGPPENFCRPAVDVLFRSAAEVYGGAALCVVLTGMGQDGLLGAQQLRACGSTVLVQDEATSVVWGMPGAIARAGLADEVLPLSEIAPEILRRSPPCRLVKGAQNQP